MSHTWVHFPADFTSVQDHLIGKQHLSVIVISQWFLTLEKLTTTKLNILPIMNAASLFQQGVLWADMVLWMFKNSQPPTQPSAIMLRVVKHLSRAHAIRFLRFCASLLYRLLHEFADFSPLWIILGNCTAEALFDDAFPSILQPRSGDEMGIMMLKRAW